VATVAAMPTEKKIVPAGFAAALALLLSIAMLVTAGSADARVIAKDGKIHACYKWKGKRKGTLKVVRGAKVRCPRKWKKVAWYASPRPGPAGAVGATGQTGPPGTGGNVVVEGLEDKVSELTTKIEALEAILTGVSNQDLLNAIAAVSAVESLCTQASTLTNQVNDVEEALGGLALNAVLTTLGGVIEVPSLPGALSSYSCPSF